MRPKGQRLSFRNGTYPALLDLHEHILERSQQRTGGRGLFFSGWDDHRHVCAGIRSHARIHLHDDRVAFDSGRGARPGRPAGQYYIGHRRFFRLCNLGPTGADATSLTDTPSSSSSNSVVGTTPPTLGYSSDPFSVPTSTIPAEISPGGFTTGSAGSMTGSSSISPQTARKLPGEATNSTTESPATTAASQASTPSITLCAPAIISTSGVSSPGSLFGAMSSNGC